MASRLIETPFVLATVWDTWVSIDPVSGRLIHKKPRHSDDYSLFKFDGENLRLHSPLPCPKAQVGAAYPSLDGWFVGTTSTGGLTIFAAGLYACAERNGSISFSRSAVRAWEIFTPIPQNEALEIRPGQILRFVPTVFGAPPIPACIHQTYMSRNLPDPLARTTEQLRSGNPNFGYRLWTDEDIHDFIHDEFGYKILRVYLRINPLYGACRADLFRYLCIYKLGGVYLDIKSSTYKPLDSIMRNDDHFLLSQWDNGPGGNRQQFGRHNDVSYVAGGEFEQWHIMATPGHPFLQHVIENVMTNIETYDPGQHGVGKIGALRVTGPIAYTRSIFPLLDRYPYRLIHSELDGLSYVAKGGYDHKKMFGQHYSSLSTPVVYS
jgi:hypothetical protein